MGGEWAKEKEWGSFEGRPLNDQGGGLKIGREVADGQLAMSV